MDGVEDVAVKCGDVDSGATDLDLLFCCLACFAEFFCCLILLTNPAKDTNAAFRDSSDVVQIVKSRDADSVETTISPTEAQNLNARSNMFGLLLTSIANCEKQ